MTDQVFKSAMDAARFLKNQGYKVSKSKLYKDLGGLLPRQADGTIRAADLMVYAATLGKDGSREQDTDRFVYMKQQAEIKKLVESTKSIILEREIKEGKYIPKDEADREKVDLVSVMEANFRHFLHTRMPDLCAVMVGQPEKIPAAIDAAQSGLDDLLNAMAGSAFCLTYDEEEK